MQRVLIIYVPRNGTLDPNGVFEEGRLFSKAAHFNFRPYFINFGYLMPSLEHFSEAQHKMAALLHEAVSTEWCTTLWFAGSGSSELARELLRAAREHELWVASYAPKNSIFDRLVNASEFATLSADLAAQDALANRKQIIHRL